MPGREGSDPVRQQYLATDQKVGGSNPSERAKSAGHSPAEGCGSRHRPTGSGCRAQRPARRRRPALAGGSASVGPFTAGFAVRAFRWPGLPSMRRRAIVRACSTRTRPTTRVATSRRRLEDTLPGGCAPGCSSVEKAKSYGAGLSGRQERRVRVGNRKTEFCFEVLGGGESFEGHEVEPDTVIDEARHGPRQLSK
jgi:hypothetical protein